MSQSFAQRLKFAFESSGSLVCVGLDPDPNKLPKDLGEGLARLAEFDRRIVDATHDIVAAYKPQIAFYSALGAEAQLESTIRYMRERAPNAVVVLDAKRGDIGNTAEAYAKEAFDRYGADAVTINPYMGEDSVRPFLARKDKGALILCRTSNLGGKDFQNLMLEGLPLYRHVARRAATQWNDLGNAMLVVGATAPQEMAELRAAHPTLPFLVPGIGAQNGDLQAVLAAGLDANGAGLLISSSRAIIYAGGGSAVAIRAAAAQLHTDINAGRALKGALDHAAVDAQRRAIGGGG
ncbi:MAG TPA: orotidine-5'-phosphate decarboxylase [Steroidobacteraceae bacterium]|nr:orotidine-5'-phosphate decarboxylase [Steroidobacteraceae bacterium]